MSDTFCILPWTHVYTNPKGMCTSCCDSRMEPFEWQQNFKDTINHSELQKLRSDLANGVKNPHCSFCWNKEDAGLESVRQIMNNSIIYKDINVSEFTNSDYSLTDPKIRYLDIRSSNLCNYKCRFCGPTLSNSWVPIWRQLTKLKNDPWPKNGIIEFDIQATDILDHIQYIRSVHLAGGEPVLMPGTYWLLDQFIERKLFDVRWSIISNTSRLSYGNKKITDLLKHFEDVCWSMSIDAIGKKHSYLRSNANDWDIVYQNSQTLIDMRKNSSLKKLFIHCSVSWLNLYAAYDVWEMYHDKVDQFDFNFVFYPAHFNIHNVLPESEIQRAIKFYESKEKHPDLDKILSFLRTKPDDCQDLLDVAKKFHEEHDQVRFENLLDCFPEWENMLKNS